MLAEKKKHLKAVQWRFDRDDDIDDFNAIPILEAEVELLKEILA